jgi:hypothetical protein
VISSPALSVAKDASKGARHLQAQGAVPLAEMPAWTLPDDNSGLDALLRSQVRLQPSSPSRTRRMLSTECSNDAFHGLQCTLERHAGSSEATDRHRLCVDNSSGMHDPYLPA